MNSTRRSEDGDDFATELRRSMRRGVTVTEIIVVVLVLAVIGAIVMSFIATEREAARRLQCLNNIHTLGVAVINYQAVNRDALPLLTDEVDGIAQGWPTALVPILIKDGVGMVGMPRDPEVAKTDKAGRTRRLARYFTCPSGPRFGTFESLSYAANAGYFTEAVWGNPDADQLSRASAHAPATITFTGEDFDLDVGLHLATGLFWRDVTAPTNPDDPAGSRQKARRMNGDILARGDGLSSTLLLAENCQCGSWDSPNVNDIAFGISVATKGDGRMPDRSSPSGAIGAEGRPLELLPDWRLRSTERPNAGVQTAAPGRAPRPSSFHAEGKINVAFADGRALAISDKIDNSVYARMLTPAGQSNGEKPLEPSELSEIGP